MNDSRWPEENLSGVDNTLAHEDEDKLQGSVEITYEGGVDTGAEAHIFNELSVSKFEGVLPYARLCVGCDEAVAQDSLHHVRVELEALKETVYDAAQETQISHGGVISETRE